MAELQNYVRTVMDFPKEGIGFKDITTLIKDGDAFKRSIDELAAAFEGAGVELVVGTESRGFIFGAALAYKLGVGLVTVRKPGKLPAETIREEYSLEYGTDAIEVHKDAIQPGQKVLIIDDLLATGGTIAATAKLVERLGAEIVGLGFLIELDFLNAREKLKKYKVESLIHYDSE